MIFDIDIDRVGRTAFIIAEWRCEETERPDPLFVDHIANIFLDKETQKIAQSISDVSLSTKHLILYRTKYFDDSLLKHIKDGTKQVAFLGAGLDTRPLRYGYEGVTYFEIDCEDVIQFKREKLNKNGYKESSVFIASDYSRDDLISNLVSHGFDPSLKTYFIWEGNTMYLKAETILSVLKTLTNHIDNFSISFDYVSKKLLDQEADFRNADELLKGFRSLGAPWVTGFESVNELAKEAMLEIVEDCLIVDVINQYNSFEKMDRQLFSDYFICTLKKD